MFLTGSACAGATAADSSATATVAVAMNFLGIELSCVKYRDNSYCLI
jgi:hypothetical protein